MKSYIWIFWFLLACYSQTLSQTILASGEQPQLTLDKKGTIRLVYGQTDAIYFAFSIDNGKTFSKPMLVGHVKDMHLGMTRGPQLATSKDYSIVTAMDKNGNIHSFRLSHNGGKWEKISNINDVEGSAPEGLMSVTGDDNNNFFAVWLDLREDHKNNICFSVMKENSGWSPNKFAYKSPESHVCECCRPSIVVKGTEVVVMFRNWLKGSRDLYMVSSSNGGMTFTTAQKLGNGTWQLNGCPMDGGGLSINSHNQIQTAWQREGIVYYAMPGQPEQKLGEGRHVSMDGNVVAWQNGPDLIVKNINGDKKVIGKGTALEVCELENKSILAIWEKDGKIIFKLLADKRQGQNSNAQRKAG